MNRRRCGFFRPRRGCVPVGDIITNTPSWPGVLQTNGAGRIGKTARGERLRDAGTPERIRQSLPSASPRLCTSISLAGPPGQRRPLGLQIPSAVSLNTTPGRGGAVSLSRAAARPPHMKGLDQ